MIYINFHHYNVLINSFHSLSSLKPPSNINILCTANMNSYCNKLPNQCAVTKPQEMRTKLVHFNCYCNINVIFLLNISFVLDSTVRKLKQDYHICKQ